MKTLLLTLLFATFCATGYGQTIKSLGYNTTNGQVVYAGTNVLTFTNAAVLFEEVNAATLTGGTVSVGGTLLIGDEAALVFDGEGAAGFRAALGATTLGTAIFTATNQVSARQALGLQAYTNTLTNSVGTVEIGSTVSNVTVGWTISPTNATYALRQLGGAGATNTITNNASTLAFSNLSLSNDTTWTLTVGDGQGVTNTATTAVLFQNYIIWGRSTNTTLDNAALQSLHTSGGGANRAFSTSRNRSITLDGGGQYLYIAYPAGFGAATFTVGGLPNSAWTVSTNSYTNASGYATNYLIYRTDTIQNGTGINIVVQ